MGDIVNKIGDDDAECLLVCPNWPNAKWWPTVQTLAAKAQFYPAGSRLFETDEGKSGPTRWGVWVYYIPSSASNDPVSVCVVNRGPEEKQLLISVQAIQDGVVIEPPCKALIDTGGSVNSLVKKGLFPDHLFRPAQRPLYSVAANKKQLEGGTREITVTLCIKGVNRATN